MPALAPLLIGGTASVVAALATQRYFARQQGSTPNLRMPKLSVPSLPRVSAPSLPKVSVPSLRTGRSSSASTKAVRQVRRAGGRVQPSVDAGRVASAVTAPVVRPAVATAKTVRSVWQLLTDGVFFGVGYVLGTRDGRPRYEQMKRQATGLGQRAGVPGLADGGRDEPQRSSKPTIDPVPVSGRTRDASDRLDGAAVVGSPPTTSSKTDVPTPADMPAADGARQTGRQRRRAQRQAR